jgi:hypothetical protein
MTKEAKKNFPDWTMTHQDTFQVIKALSVSTECLTMINHKCPSDNEIFVTSDTSNWLKPAEKNYPVHEKELLMII